MERLYSKIMILQLAGVAVLLVFPQIALWLPNFSQGK
jgi:hypothetical protein